MSKLSLKKHINDHVSLGSRPAITSMHYHAMPEGYELMLSPDKFNHYWLREDGINGKLNWDAFTVLRDANWNSQFRYLNGDYAVGAEIDIDGGGQ